MRDLLHRTGGIRPAPKRRWELRLSLSEREEISRGLAAGLSLRMIASGLGRAPSTVSRAAAADRAAWSRAVRPKATKLATSPALAALASAMRALDWSPQRIAGWLKIEFPDDGQMQVSHKSIYRSLFVQSRGSRPGGARPLGGADALAAKITTLPAALTRTLTFWLGRACGPCRLSEPGAVA